VQTAIASSAEEAFMRTIVLIVAALALPSENARADGAWCSYYAQGGTNCGFHSYEQCMANISGIGGSCQRNPVYQASTDSRRRRQGYD
jgi:hypothetical protein